MLQGRYGFPAIERVVFGIPARRAVAEEAEAFGGRRVFVLSTRSLQSMGDGPLQEVEAGLGPRHAGTFSAIGAHGPDVDVITPLRPWRALREPTCCWRSAAAR